MGQDYFREISKKLLLKPFLRSGLSANKITVLNFLTLCLGSVVLFLTGHSYIGLLVAGLAAMVDYIDGEVARSRGGNSKLGQYLDTSLDWLWLQLLIFSISYSNGVLPFGCLAIIVIMWGNWVEYNGGHKLQPPFPLGISHLLVIGVLFGCSNLTIMLILCIQSIRVAIMYRRYIWNTYNG